MSDRAGQQLGNYQLLRLLGQGSLASVYLGEHLHLHTQAAVKLLHTSLTDSGTEQLRVEAQTMARLAHPHIVRLFDFGVEKGEPFLVMEYAPHGSLRQRYPKGSLIPLALLVPYVKQIASALQYAHEQKFIHRDIKPENMLLGLQDTLLLTEFDLAVIAQSSRSAQILAPAGSVIYMAPEQLLGQPRPASDQYALGIVTYEWLSGEPPFSGSVQHIASQHLSSPPPLLHPKVPTATHEIERVVLKALAKDPKLRFANIQDFALALEEAYQADRSGRVFILPGTTHAGKSGFPEAIDATLPTGTVTFLFASLELSSSLLPLADNHHTNVSSEHQHILRTTLEERNGHEFKTQVDAFFFAFTRATDAVLAAVEMQRALASVPLDHGSPIRMRVGIHTGEPLLTNEGYIGPDLHRLTHIMRAAHGGQVLLSQATYNLVEQDLPEYISLHDLGEYRLKDLGRPRHLFQLLISDLPGNFPYLRTLDTYPNNLPIQPTPFIGREQELITVQELLYRDKLRLLTLTGPGGAGKTRLGLQVAAELSDHFAAGVFFVNLSHISDPALVLSTIALTLGIREKTGQSLFDHLREELLEKRLLLILDNVEQVVSAAHELGDLLAACPQLKMLVTSREVLHIRAEHEFAVPLLELPHPSYLPDLATLSHNTAVALFLQRAQAVKPDFQLTDVNARTIVEICVRLEGLPLAIELAAARVKLLPLQALLSRLDQRLTVLTSTSRDVPERQQTLRNTIAWSYNLLHAVEQRLFRWLSVFVGGCTLQAVMAVCAVSGKKDKAEQVMDNLASLIDKSLLQQIEQESQEPYLVMLETIQEYGLERLAANEEKAAAQEAHANYYLHLVETMELANTNLQSGEWPGWLEREHDNLRAVLQWALEHEIAREKTEKLSQLLQLFTARKPPALPVNTLIETQQIPEIHLRASTPDFANLTAREIEVLRLLGKGLADKRIAEELVLSPRTVNNHLTSIYQKIQVSTRTAAVLYAIEHHIVDPSSSF